MKTEQNGSRSLFSFRKWQMQHITGLILIGIVLAVSVQSDMRSTKAHLMSAVSYIKEQANNYQRLELASKTKSLMSTVKDAHQIKDMLLSEQVTDIDDRMLEQTVKDGYSTGAIILYIDGNIIAQYHKEDKELLLADEELYSKALLETAIHPEKSYTVRIECEDGTHIDLAAVGLGDNKHIAVACYHAPLDYIESYSQSINYLLSGYNTDEGGTIVIVDNDKIIVSTDNSLLGSSIYDVPILEKIKRVGASDRLVNAAHPGSAILHDFGLMEHGLEYYVYVFMPERNVFSTSPRNAIYALVLYIILLIIFNASCLIS